MKLEFCNIEGLTIIHPDVFEDERGYFYESFNKEKFAAHGLKMEFVQDNQSLSHKGVLRGLHFQKKPHSQGKLVRIVRGSVLDVAVDIRTQSKTYGQYFSIELSEQNKTMFYIPEGFAHGFLTLEDNTVFSYKCTNLYNKASEETILWNDSYLDIDWRINNPIISEKDKTGFSFNTLPQFF